MCGGTGRQLISDIGEIGLSPRVRGNPAPSRCTNTAAGSIPACAGEPRPVPAAAAARVYPRVCGGTSICCSKIRPRKGLSPRVRGNPFSPSILLPAAGSIPACAGEPGRLCRPVTFRGVYPRVCGGTRLTLWLFRPCGGLSPRVRGNRGQFRRRRRRPGSIPACAGEPWILTPQWSAMAVYPRVCGGTGIAALGKPARQGLSPRVRGNLSV